MTMNEDKLRSALSVIASAPEPPTTIDIAAARRRGARRQQVRQVVAPVAVALTVAAAVIVPLTQFRAAPRPVPATPVQAPAEFNPLVPYAAFGWLPAGFSESLVPASLSNVLASQTGWVKRGAYAPKTRSLHVVRSISLFVNARGACKAAAAPGGVADT